MRRRLLPLLVGAAALALGFVLTAPGVATWDSLPHLDRSRWLVHMLGLPSSRPSNGLLTMLKWYGPLWALFLGLASELPFRFVHDPLWVQQAFNFALFPVGLYAVYRLLTRAGEAPSTAGLAAALLFGVIRLGGHALVNVNDFPMAMLSLLVMLYLWNKLRDSDAVARATGRFGTGTLALVGAAAMVPFLIRPPVLIEPLILTGFFLVYAATTWRDRSKSERAALVGVPLAAGTALAIAIWPALWERSRTLPLRTALLGFIRFNWVGSVRYFGHTALSTQLPRFYPFVWLPVMMSPVAFLVFLVGIGRFFARRESAEAPALVLRTSNDRAAITLRRWIALHAGLMWLGVLVLHPTLYDEERHVLFLYPPLLILAALALADAREIVKRALIVLIVATSLFSYAGWGRYAYVYKSPLIGDRSAHRFTGDYWGVCIPAAVGALQGRVPAGAEVVVPGPVDAAVAEYQRLRESRFLSRSGFGPYRLVGRGSPGATYFILYNRMGFLDGPLQAVRAGRLSLLWQTNMPPGEPACALVKRAG
jgi:hypothetical protein